MSNHRASALASFFFALAVSCEKAPAPPPEVASSPAETAAPQAATTEVAMPESSAATAPAEPSATTAPAEPSATSVASAAPGPSAAPPKETSHKAAAAAPKPVQAAAEGTAAPAAGPGTDDPCQTKKFHYSQVASACKSGGRKSAKVVMKGAVTKAKAAGTDLKCTSCHEDMKDFHLKSNAVGDLKNWL
jgi:hypothetical protein